MTYQWMRQQRQQVKQKRLNELVKTLMQMIYVFQDPTAPMLNVSTSPSLHLLSAMYHCSPHEAPQNL